MCSCSCVDVWIWSEISSGFLHSHVMYSYYVYTRFCACLLGYVCTYVPKCTYMKSYSSELKKNELKKYLHLLLYICKIGSSRYIHVESAASSSFSLVIGESHYSISLSSISDYVHGVFSSYVPSANIPYSLIFTNWKINIDSGSLSSFIALLSFPGNR